MYPIRLRVPVQVAVALLIALGACAGPVRWQHPSLPRDQWSKDQALCERAASMEIEKELVREQNYLGRGQEPGADPLKASMTRYDAIKRRNRLTASCMRARGYTTATGDGG
jgi:hypothetical protein